MCCEQSTLMEVRHSTRSPFLYFTPSLLVHMLVSKLYLMFALAELGDIPPLLIRGPLFPIRVKCPNSDRSDPTNTILRPASSCRNANATLPLS